MSMMTVSRRVEGYILSFSFFFFLNIRLTDRHVELTDRFPPHCGRVRQKSNVDIPTYGPHRPVASRNATGGKWRHSPKL